MLIKGSSYIINQEVLPKSLQPAVLTLISDIRDRELLGLLEGYHVNKATHFIHLCVCVGGCASIHPCLKGNVISFHLRLDLSALSCYLGTVFSVV